MPRAAPTFHFVGGKGGVGKTTCSAALGIAAASGGRKVLVASTDPAPSLGDAFDVRLTSRPRRITASRRQLFAAELDASASFRRWITNRQHILESIALNGTWLDDSWLSHLSLSTDQWVRRMEFSLSVRNLFAQRYEHPAAETNWQNALAQDGRSVQIRTDYRF